MEIITSNYLKQFLEQDKRKFEGLLPELVKKLILSSSPQINTIRMPGRDDVWAPGFDGIVDCQEKSTYVAEGKSVWEFGTSSDSLSKINSDYDKRTADSLGIDTKTATFYLVVPKVWAYDTSTTQWESEHRVGWRDIHIYDASVICDWINSEPAVCAWLIEQFRNGISISFSSVADAWKFFSKRTNPPLSSSLFMEGRQDTLLSFQDSIHGKMCRVKSSTSVDAYGFCLSALLQDADTANQVIVVHNENTYLELSRNIKGKTFLLSFPFFGQVSDSNRTIVCYSNESTRFHDMIELTPLWKTQFTKALREMGLSDTEASECYSFTHGNLLSLFRRIPGNNADAQPKWAKEQGVEFLCPIVFLRHFCTENELEKRIVSMIARVDYESLIEKYESFLRLEDSPIKKADEYIHIINYEEAWFTLNIGIGDIMSSRLFNVIITLLSECKNDDWYQSQPKAAIISRLIYNYIYFSETGSEKRVIGNQINTILEFAKEPGCKDMVLKSLPVLAEAAPVEVLNYIEAEMDTGVVAEAFRETDSWSGSYTHVLWALDKLVVYEDSAISACRILQKLCALPKEYHNGNSPKESLLNALCLWDNHTAVTLAEKKGIALRFIDGNSEFGVPFAIDLIAKDSVLRGVRVGEKERTYDSATREDLYRAYYDISSKIMSTSIREKKAEWIESLLKVYWYIPCEVIADSVNMLAENDFTPEQKLPIIFLLKNHIYSIKKYALDERSRWIEPFEKMLDKLVTQDPVSKEGWRFYKYEQAPFQELCVDRKDNYFETINQIKTIREKKFAHIREEFGSGAITLIANCMEDSRAWGVFLGENLAQSEINAITMSVRGSDRTQILAGMVSTFDYSVATMILNSLAEEELEAVLPLIQRDDISDWLKSEELRRLYWESKQLTEYNDQAYHCLLKYNPCGILPIFINLDRDEETERRLQEVLLAIIDNGNYTDSGLLTHIIQQYDAMHYTDEWAELCIKLYDSGVFRGVYGYYPSCIKTYFFRHPEKIVERFQTDTFLYMRLFCNQYALPVEAYENKSAFFAWSDFLYEKAIEDSHFSALGSILGRSIPGADGIFPHEFVREALEKYSNIELTRDVAIGWFNSRGARFVTDGLAEKKTADQYHSYARSLELEYPQTSKLLRMIADDYGREAKRDQQYSETFPQ